MMDPLDTLISSAQRAAVRAPIEVARPLPPQAFMSEAFFDLEVERIFSRHWTALGFVQQVPEPGDVLPVELCGIPLLIVRGDDGGARVFHNIVPYDSCLAVIEAAHVEHEIITPYHGWRYDLRGKLTAIPDWDGTKQGQLSSLRGRSVDLVAVRTEMVCGIVFVDLSGSAASFESYIAPLRKVLSKYRIDDLDIGRSAAGEPLLSREDVATNWKTYYENWAINVLHESFVHEIYATSPQMPRVNKRGDKTYVEHIDSHFMALCYREQDFLETYQMEEFPFASVGRDQELCPAQSVIGSLFPNLHLATFSSFFHISIALPENTERTRAVVAQLYEAESANNDAFLDVRLGIAEAFRVAGNEDGRITQAVQKARRSSVCERTFYSPFWDTMHYTFSNMVLDALERNGTRCG